MCLFTELYCVCQKYPQMFGHASHVRMTHFVINRENSDYLAEPTDKSTCLENGQMIKSVKQSLHSHT